MYEEFPLLDGRNGTGRTVQLARVLPRSTRRTQRHQTTRIQSYWGQEVGSSNLPSPTVKQQKSRPLGAGSPRSRVPDSEMYTECLHPSVEVESIEPSSLRDQSNSSTRRSASSTAASSSRLSWPTNSPKRSAATAEVRSTRTCVDSSPIVIVGRKRRADEDRDVGATRTVEGIRSSDWRMTA